MDDLDLPEVSDTRRAAVSRRSSGRGTLSRAEILCAAIELIDADGLRALSMRQLGRQLGVEAMALYHHVPSRDPRRPPGSSRPCAACDGRSRSSPPW